MMLSFQILAFSLVAGVNALQSVACEEASPSSRPARKNRKKSVSWAVGDSTNGILPVFKSAGSFDIPLDLVPAGGIINLLKNFAMFYFLRIGLLAASSAALNFVGK